MPDLSKLSIDEKKELLKRITLNLCYSEQLGFRKVRRILFETSELLYVTTEYPNAKD